MSNAGEPQVLQSEEGRQRQSSKPAAKDGEPWQRLKSQTDVVGCEESGTRQLAVRSRKHSATRERAANTVAQNRTRTNSHDRTVVAQRADSGLTFLLVPVEAEAGEDKGRDVNQNQQRRA